MTETTTKPQRKPLSRYLPIAIVAILFALAIVFRVHERFSLDALYAQSESLDAFVMRNYAIAIAIFMGVYALAVASSIPGASFLTLSAGFLFGTWIGGAAAWIAATIGATLIFLAARTAFGDALRARAGGWLTRLGAGFRNNAFSYLLVLRLTPVAPFFVVNLAPAFFNVKLRDYVLATLLGMIPGAFVYASVGDGLRAALETGAAANPNEAARAILLSPQVFGPILALIALALLPIAIKAMRGRKAEAPQ
ncbi:MAG: VTT domain-containing protein [Hyphomonadaceae bacterium]|nr:VTT domain-containing protein [Hyphomonadaceae bacterium]